MSSFTKKKKKKNMGQNCTLLSVTECDSRDTVPASSLSFKMAWQLLLLSPYSPGPTCMNPSCPAGERSWRRRYHGQRMISREATKHLICEWRNHLGHPRWTRAFEHPKLQTQPPSGSNDMRNPYQDLQKKSLL